MVFGGVERRRLALRGGGSGACSLGELDGRRAQLRAVGERGGERDAGGRPPARGVESQVETAAVKSGASGRRGNGVAAERLCNREKSVGVIRVEVRDRRAGIGRDGIRLRRSVVRPGRRITS